MKTFTTLLLAALMCGSALAAGPKSAPSSIDAAAAKRLSDWRVIFEGRDRSKPQIRMPEMEAMYATLAAGDKIITRRELLAGYATGDDKLTRFVLEWVEAAKLGEGLIAALDAEVATMTKAGDPQTSLVRRASEKFAQQLKENGLRPDAKAAMADALEALKVES